MVSFDTREELGDKIDKLVVMIGKLVTRDSGANRQLNNKFTKVEAEDKIVVTMTDAIIISKVIKTDIGQIVETKDSIDRTEVGPGMKKNYRRSIFRGNVRNFDRQNSRGEYRNSYRNEGYDRSRNRSRERSFSRSYSGNRNRSTSNSRSRSGLRASTNRDRIRCNTSREYDHFTKDCATSREEKELEQLQQMLNLEDEQTSLKSLVTNAQDNFSRVNSEEN